MRSLIPLGLFLLGLAAIFVGTVQAAFTALMRFPLRLSAERNGASDELIRYLREPVLLFVPARMLSGLVLVLAVELTALLLAVDSLRGFGVLLLVMLAFTVVCGHLVPLLIVRSNPQAVLEFLLPVFRVPASLLLPVTLAMLGLSKRDRERERDRDAAILRGGETAPLELTAGTSTVVAPVRGRDDVDSEEHGDERRLLQSIVDFGDILVREVMTPRPDVVAIRADATVAQMRALFREQQYSRIPAFHDNLDNIAGFVFVKDLLLVEEANVDERQLSTLLRPATFTPETKRVPELLKEFQQKQVQCAIVVDEYGGTAGLVTIEDLLEEIVGEIRDEYDVETEPIVDEGDGSFVVSGKADVDMIAERLDVEIEREGFETVGGYLLSHLGRVPSVGETFDIDDLTVEVLEAAQRRIHKVRVRRKQPVAPTSA